MGSVVIADATREYSRILQDRLLAKLLPRMDAFGIVEESVVTRCVYYDKPKSSFISTVTFKLVTDVEILAKFECTCSMENLLGATLKELYLPYTLILDDGCGAIISTLPTLTSDEYTKSLSYVNMMFREFLLKRKGAKFSAYYSSTTALLSKFLPKLQGLRTVTEHSTYSAGGLVCITPKVKDIDFGDTSYSSCFLEQHKGSALVVGIFSKPVTDTKYLKFLMIAPPKKQKKTILHAIPLTDLNIKAMTYLG